MSGVHGIGGVFGPTPERPSDVRDQQRPEEAGTSPRPEDGVEISPAAQEAAGVARLVQLAQEGEEIRTERVAAAKESIERGDFKRPEVVAEVARRISQFLFGS